MPVTTLDPKTALIVIDLQKGIVSLPTAFVGWVADAWGPRWALTGTLYKTCPALTTQSPTGAASAPARHPSSPDNISK